MIKLDVVYRGLFSAKNEFFNDIEVKMTSFSLWKYKKTNDPFQWTKFHIHTIEDIFQLFLPWMWSLFKVYPLLLSN